MKSILDKSFRYTPSSQTDLAKKFAEIRLEQRKLYRAVEVENANVLSLKQHAARRDRAASYR